MRFYLIDKVTELISGETARAIKNISLADDCFNEHFDGYPIYPGTLIVEGVAQLAGLLLEYTTNSENTQPRRAVLVQIEKAKFHRPAVPGDQLDIRCKILSMLDGAGQAEGDVFVQGEKISSVVLTFVLKHIDLPQIHTQRLELYRIWTKGLNLSAPIL